MTLLLEVYQPDGTTLIDTIDDGQYGELNVNETLNLRGGGRIVLPRYIDGDPNPAIALCQPGRIIRVSEDGDQLGELQIEEPNDTVVSDDDEAGERLVLSGRESMAIAFDKVVWYPDRGLGRLPFNGKRPLGFAANRLRDDDPDGPQGPWPLGFGQTPGWNGVITFGRAAGYIDTAGPNGDGPEFIAAFDSRVDGAPAGVQFFRQRVILDDDYDDVLYQAMFDDEGQLWDDDVPILKAEGVYKGRCVQFRGPMSAGEHLIAGFVRNLNAQRIGVAFAGWRVEDGMAKELLFRSDASACRILAYPDDPPGFTHTEVLRLGIDEAQDRGLLVDVTPDFLSAVDTNGAPMSEVTDVVVDAPDSTLFTTVKVLGETALDIVAAIDPVDGKVLRVYKRGTLITDRTATHQYGKGNCRLIERDDDYAEQATVVIVTVDGHPPFEVVHPDAADLGRKEIPLNLGPCSPATGRRWARLYLDEVSNARRGIVLELSPGIGPTPWPSLGDKITLTDGFTGTGWGGEPITWDGEAASWAEAHRVVSRGVRVGADSKIRRVLELDQPRIIRAERLQNILRRHLAGAGGARSVLPSSKEPSFRSQEAPQEKEHAWQWDGPLGDIQFYKNGVAIAGAVVDGISTPDETNSTVLTDPAREYQYGVDKVTFTAGGSTNHSPAYVPPEGRWIQEIRATSSENEDGLHITISVLTA